MMHSQNIHKLFSMPVIIAMRHEIEKADNNEVFFTGAINSVGIVTSVITAARGNEEAVSVNITEMRKCSVLIHNHPNGILKPSEADLGVASHVSENAQGFYIINNEVTKAYVVVPQTVPLQIKKLDLEKTAFYISKDGPFAQKSDSYEERYSQIELLKQICTSFNTNSVGVFEAGTGVGKSFAYLIPAIEWACLNKQRIIVSTGTINLQQQITEKDIPVAEKILGKNIKYILLKGRQNYVCKRRLQAAAADRDLFNEDQEVIDIIAHWSKESATGSRSDLSFVPSDAVWTRVNSESDACMGMRCPFYEDCFVMAERKKAADANVIVVNHHLLFADIESRMNGVGYDDAAVLPPYKHIVFDEAHGIESAATSFFSQSLNRFLVTKQLNLLYKKRKNSVAGYIFTISILSDSTIQSDSVIEVINQVHLDIMNLETAALDVLSNEYTVRLFENTARTFSSVLSLLLTLGESIGTITGLVREIIEEIPDEDTDNAVVWETKSILRRLDDVCVVCRNFSVWNEHRDFVFWMQKKRLSADFIHDNVNPFYPVFTMTPLDIAPLMNTGVFEPMESVVCTSATLKIGNSFNYWLKRTGLGFVDKKRIIQKEFLSPFSYEKNMIFAVTKDAPFPSDQKFTSYVTSALKSLIEAADGRTLILFTAYEMLRYVYDSVKYSMSGTGIAFLKQGDDDRSRLLENFKKDTRSVLFATSSFWQGIDVPGDSLSQVVIVKLPFSVPNDPVFAARSDLVTKSGGSPFMELSLPEAVIKFRQGIGRLIRRGDDRGAVVVLDRRIVEKQYGRIFIQSMPKTRMIYSSVNEIANTVSSFFIDREN